MNGRLVDIDVYISYDLAVILEYFTMKCGRENAQILPPNAACPIPPPSPLVLCPSLVSEWKESFYHGLGKLRVTAQGAVFKLQKDLIPGCNEGGQHNVCRR